MHKAFVFSSWKIDSLNIRLITWQWQYSHNSLCLHLLLGMRRSSAGIFKKRSIWVDLPKNHDSAAHNQLGQLAWEPADVPSGRLNGSRRLAVRLYPLLAPLPQTTLRVWGPSLLCLQPVCCFTLRQCRIASSFVLLFFNIAAVMHRCTAVVCFIILIPVMDLFMQSAEYLCFGWLENDELYQWGHVYPLDEVLFHQKSLGSVTFWNVHCRRSWIVIMAKMIKWADVAV